MVVDVTHLLVGVEAGVLEHRLAVQRAAAPLLSATNLIAALDGAYRSRSRPA